MFRRLPNQLPPDPVVPADLTKLGYFITENDQIRQIRNPNQMFQVRINKNERVNEVYKNAMNTCVRNVVHTRLLDLGLDQIRLPLGTAPSDKHIPIYVSKDLHRKKHVIVLFTDRHTDPGILSYRVTGDEGINVGSLVNFVKAVLYGPDLKEADEQGSSSSAVLSPDSSPEVLPSNAERPGLIVANASQLLWYRGGGRAVTSQEWMSLPRESAVHQPFRINEAKNRIPENCTFEEHVEYIFGHILSTSSPLDTSSTTINTRATTTSTAVQKGAERETEIICNPTAKFSIIGFEYVGSTALQYLATNWSRWSSRIVCIALMTPQHDITNILSLSDTTNNLSTDACTGTDTELSTGTKATSKAKQIQQFIAHRARAYRVSPAMPETPLSGRQTLGCNIYASGETLYEENVFVRCWPRVLDWIEMCHFSETFEEPVLEINPENEEAGVIGSPRRFQRQFLKVAEEVEMDMTSDGKLTLLEQEAELS